MTGESVEPNKRHKMAEMFVFALSVVMLAVIMPRSANCVDYLNSTIDFAKMVDDFTLHQSTSRRTDRNSRLISFDTRNDNIEVFQFVENRICTCHGIKIEISCAAK